MMASETMPSGFGAFVRGRGVGRPRSGVGHLRDNRGGRGVADGLAVRARHVDRHIVGARRLIDMRTLDQHRRCRSRPARVLSHGGLSPQLICAW